MVEHNKSVLSNLDLSLVSMYLSILLNCDLYKFKRLDDNALGGFFLQRNKVL